MQTIQTKVPLISFIIPCYNVPTDMLRQCIRSILDLDIREGEREVIIVDDGSDSSPINEIEEISSHCLYIRQRNRGPSAARNAGLRIASGEYIQFVDSDDALIKTPYEAVIEIVKDTKADAVLFRHTTKESEKLKVKSENLALHRPNCSVMSGAAYIANNNLRAAAWGYTFRKGALGALTFDETLMTHEDEAFTPRLLLRAEHVCEAPLTAYYYRPRETSLTGKRDMEAITRRMADGERVLRELKELTYTLPDGDKVAICRRVAQLTMDYLYNIITLTHSSEALEEAILRLRDRGLFPLPQKNYTAKYTAFRLATATKLSRKLLIKML